MGSNNMENWQFSQQFFERPIKEIILEGEILPKKAYNIVNERHADCKGLFLLSHVVK